MKDDFDPMGSRRDAFDFATGMSKMLHGIEAAEQSKLLAEQVRLQKEALELEKQKLAQSGGQAQSGNTTQATASNTYRRNRETYITFDRQDARFQEVERERTATLKGIEQAGGWFGRLTGSSKENAELQRARWGEEIRTEFEYILEETKLSRRKEMLREFERKYGKVSHYSSRSGVTKFADKNFFGWEIGIPEEDGDIRCIPGI